MSNSAAETSAFSARRSFSAPASKSGVDRYSRASNSGNGPMRFGMPLNPLNPKAAVLMTCALSRTPAETCGRSALSAWSRALDVDVLRLFLDDRGEVVIETAVNGVGERQRQVVSRRPARPARRASVSADDSAPSSAPRRRQGGGASERPRTVVSSSCAQSLPEQPRRPATVSSIGSRSTRAAAGSPGRARG